MILVQNDSRAMIADKRGCAHGTRRRKHELRVDAPATVKKKSWAPFFWRLSSKRVRLALFRGAQIEIIVIDLACTRRFFVLCPEGFVEIMVSNPVGTSSKSRN